MQTPQLFKLNSNSLIQLAIWKFNFKRISLNWFFNIFDFRLCLRFVLPADVFSCCLLHDFRFFIQLFLLTFPCTWTKGKNFMRYLCVYKYLKQTINCLLINSNSNNKYVRAVYGIYDTLRFVLTIWIYLSWRICDSFNDYLGEFVCLVAICVGFFCLSGWWGLFENYQTLIGGGSWTILKLLKAFFQWNFCVLGDFTSRNSINA